MNYKRLGAKLILPVNISFSNLSIVYERGIIIRDIIKTENSLYISGMDIKKNDINVLITDIVEMPDELPDYIFHIAFYLNENLINFERGFENIKVGADWQILIEESSELSAYAKAKEFAQQLIEKQESLGQPFEEILFKNIADLYQCEEP